MALRIAVTLLLLFGTSIGQDSAPISLVGKDAALVCRGKDKHTPSCVTPPRATYSPIPGVPKAVKARRSGTVRLWIVVGSDGLPRDIRVEQSLSPDLDDAAIDAVKTWKFAPATKDSKNVAVQIDVEVSFRF